MNSWNEETFKDFTFKFKGKKIKAHQMVLASMSPVFRKMFTVEMAEKKQQETTISDFDGHVFGIFLSLFYGYTIGEEEDISTGMKCYELIHLYEVEDLKEDASNFIVRKANISNVEQVIDFLEVYDVPAVKEVTVKILQEGEVTVGNAVHLLQLSAKIKDDALKNRVFDFISHKKIQVSRIIDWGLISATVGDKLQEFIIDKFAKESKELQDLKEKLDECKSWKGCCHHSTCDL